MPQPFPRSEFEARCAKAQAAMAREGIAAMLLTSEPDLRYFTGFLTRFWESHTRPWFLLVPASGKPVAVIPTIGAELMAQSWLSDIRTWTSPDYDDDGVTLLAKTIRELVPDGARLGVPLGRETALRMPPADWDRLCALIEDRPRCDVSALLRTQQEVKSPAEIALIRETCAIAGRAYARVPELLTPGVTLAQVFRRFQMLLLEEGADWVSYLAGGAARGGYGDVISPADDRPLAAGDLLMLDTGAVRQGYFCDYDRNWAVGHATPEVQDAHRRLHDAALAGFEAARPGATCADLHRTIVGALGQDPGGRVGHGLGMRLTEWPSLIPADNTVLRPGMVLTLEPWQPLGPGRMLVHEENIVIGENGAEWLSPLAPREIPVIDWPMIR